MAFPILEFSSQSNSFSSRKALLNVEARFLRGSDANSPVLVCASEKRQRGNQTTFEVFREGAHPADFFSNAYPACLAKT